MSELRHEIKNEAGRIMESVELSFVQHFIVAKWWRRAHFVMGVLATVGATTSTALTFAETAPLVNAIIGLSVAILAGLITFLNPKYHADAHHQKGVDLQQLAARARMLINIECQETGSDSDLKSSLKALSDRKFDLDKNSPATPGGVFYRLAKKSVTSGETKHDVDRQT